MSEHPLADPDPHSDSSREQTTDGGTAGVRVVLPIVVEARQMLDTPTQLAVPQPEGLSAAEKLLAELEAAWTERV